MTINDAYTLINCTGKDTFLLVAGQRVLLSTAPQPIIGCSSPDSGVPAAPAEFRVDPTDTAAALVRVTNAKASWVLFMPEQLPGVRYLVTAEILLRCPWRTDFVTPGGYGTLPWSNAAEDVTAEPALPPVDEADGAKPDTKRARTSRGHRRGAALEFYLVAAYSAMDLVASDAHVISASKVDEAFDAIDDPGV